MMEIISVLLPFIGEVEWRKTTAADVGTRAMHFCDGLLCFVPTLLLTSTVLGLQLPVSVGMALRGKGVGRWENVSGTDYSYQNKPWILVMPLLFFRLLRNTVGSSIRLCV